MKTLRSLPVLLLSLIGLAPTAPAATAIESRNKDAVQAAFDAWRDGTGGPFGLLAPEATWTITGHSLAAKRYASRDEFIDTVIKPFNARLIEPLRPVVRRLVAEGDTVVVHFDAQGMALDSIPYRNTYAWFMTFRGDQVIEVTAFFDAIAFDEFWRRVEPQP